MREKPCLDNDLGLECGNGGVEEVCTTLRDDELFRKVRILALDGWLREVHDTRFIPVLSDFKRLKKNVAVVSNNVKLTDGVESTVEILPIEGLWWEFDVVRPD